MTGCSVLGVRVWSVEYGAKSMVYAAVEPSIEGQGGSYYGPLYARMAAFNVFNCMKQEPANPAAEDPEAR